MESAQKEIKITGTLSPATYAAVLPVIEKIQALEAQHRGGNIPVELKIDDQLLPLLEKQRELLEMVLENLRSIIEQEFEDSRPTNALPSDSVVKDILRYETAAQKQFNWALKNLLESQQRRRKARAPVSV